MKKSFNSDDILIVINRSSHGVSYPIPESQGRWRDFRPGESKKITYGELEAVLQQNGCAALFAKYLLIKDPGAVQELTNTKPEIEYYMTEDQIKKWLPTCSLDQFLDALDFAPDGVLTLIKKYAVSLPLSDMNKCNAIKEKLQFDVLKAIELNKTDTPVKQEEKKVRRAAVAQPTGTTGRRVTLSSSEENT